MAVLLLGAGVAWALYFRWNMRRGVVVGNWGIRAERETNPVGFWFMQIVSALCSAGFLLAGLATLLGRFSP